MKKVFKSLMVAAVGVWMMSSCASVLTPVGYAGAYTGVTSGQAATGNNVGKKVGTSSAINVLGVVAIGDAGINKAAKEAGIKKISHVDKEVTSILGLFSSYKTIVYGE